MKKSLIVLAIILLVLVQLPAAGSQEGKAPVKRYSIGTSSSGGNFYLIGGGLATVLNNALPDRFVFTSEETGGSTANLAMIENGEAEMGFAMTSALYEGATGIAAWNNGKPMKNVQGLVPLYPSYMTMYVLANNPIRSISDFNGRIVGLGSKGAAMDNVLRDAYSKMGVKPQSIFNDGHGATATAVSQGQVDVSVSFSYPPFAAITELEATKNLRFIGVTPEEQAFLVAEYPYYSASTMPKGSYAGATADVPTVSEWNMLVVAASLPEDEVYLIVKTLFENNPELLAIHNSLQYCTPENTLNFNIPLHPGVIKYLKEKGISVPTSLIP